LAKLIVWCLNGNFSVPFEEDDKDPRIWFLDHNYHESMFSMFKRINGNSWEHGSLVCISLYGAFGFKKLTNYLFQPRSMLWGGTALGQNWGKMTWRFTDYLTSKNTNCDFEVLLCWEPIIINLCPTFKVCVLIADRNWLVWLVLSASWKIESVLVKDFSIFSSIHQV
jgi:hypothetical protein